MNSELIVIILFKRKRKGARKSKKKVMFKKKKRRRKIVKIVVVFRRYRGCLKQGLWNASKCVGNVCTSEWSFKKSGSTLMFVESNLRHCSTISISHIGSLDSIKNKTTYINRDNQNTNQHNAYGQHQLWRMGTIDSTGNTNTTEKSGQYSEHQKLGK